MYTVIITLCLIASPDKCKEVTRDILEEISMPTPQQCILFSQKALVQEAESNADWRIAKYRCARDTKGI